MSFRLIGLVVVFWASSLLFAEGPAVVAPTWEEVSAAAIQNRTPPPSKLAYLIALRFAAPGSRVDPAAFIQLVGSAERALRFGGSPQEIGARIRRTTRLAESGNTFGTGMLRLERVETRNSVMGAGSPESAGIRGRIEAVAGVMGSTSGALSGDASGAEGQPGGGDVPGGGTTGGVTGGGSTGGGTTGGSTGGSAATDTTGAGSGSGSGL